MNQNNQIFFLNLETRMYARSRIGRGIIQANGYIHFQFHFMYNKHLIAAEERVKVFPFLIRTTESIVIP